MKTCRKCLRDLLLEDFHRHPNMADGRLHTCKGCKKSYDKSHRTQHHAEVSAWERQRSKTPERRAQAAQSQIRSRLRHPEKYRARTAVGNALRDGRLQRGPCAVCGTDQDVQAHHEDYSKPLVVIWLCFTHHRTDGHQQTVELQQATG